MSKPYPFYARNRGIGVVDAYHTHPECQIGQSIPEADCQPGSPPGWPECAFCRVLRPAGQVLPGQENAAVAAAQGGLHDG